MREKDRGFTLIELLVVISIISLLSGMMIGVVMLAKQSAKKTQAKEEMSQLTTAWNQMLLVRRSFPSIAVTEMDADAVNLLAGTHSNISGKIYMEFTTNQMIRGFADPWGGLYQVCIDNGMGGDPVAYDGRVVYNGSPVTKPVVVWSHNQDTNDVSDDILGWRQ